MRSIEKNRLLMCGAGMLALLALVSFRLYDVAYVQHKWYSQTAQANIAGGGAPLRGSIALTDGNTYGFLVATNRKFPELVIMPSRLDRERTGTLIDNIAKIAGVDRETIAGRAVRRRLDDMQAEEIKKLDAPGVSLIYKMDRSYPAGMLAADVIGFFGYSKDKRRGQYGVEEAYDTELSDGAPDAIARRWNPITQLKGLFWDHVASDSGDDGPQDIQMTIDKNIQAYTQDVLDSVLKKYAAASGVVIVQEPQSGRILAMADSPSFDPNGYGSYPIAAFANGAIQPFEPGSSFKPFTMAMGLDIDKITPQSTYDDDNDIVVDGYTIKNFNEGHFGRVTMTKVLEKSINSGVMYVRSLLTNDEFLNYVVNMGFGQKTGVDLPGESSGNIGNLYTGRAINFMTASFGQGITVTPLQLINGYSAIANGGRLMRPYVVSSLRDERGNVREINPEVISTPFLPKTADTLRAMLTSVVDNGFDKARIPRYDVAGKTGTAQIADPVNGGYMEDQYNHSFVGFAPASDPKFVVLIKMERPRGITFAADSLSPAFRDIALFLLNYLNIPPTR